MCIRDRHTCSHVLAQAMKRLHPEVKLAIGPAIDNGFYYDFDTPEPFSESQLAELEAEMRKICKEKLKLERFEPVSYTHLNPCVAGAPGVFSPSFWLPLPPQCLPGVISFDGLSLFFSLSRYLLFEISGAVILPLQVKLFEGI